MALAEILKELRLRKGESLQKVADAVGVSKAHIWELEKGTSANPGIELLSNLAQHFNVTVSFLANEESTTWDVATQQFFREFEGQLSDKDWDVLRAMAERLKDKDQ